MAKDGGARFGSQASPERAAAMVLTEALCRAAYSKNLSVGELLQVKRASGARRKVHDDMTACVVFLDAGAYAGGRRSTPLASRSASHGEQAR